MRGTLWVRVSPVAWCANIMRERRDLLLLACLSIKIKFLLFFSGVFFFVHTHVTGDADFPRASYG